MQMRCCFFLLGLTLCLSPSLTRGGETVFEQTGGSASWQQGIDWYRQMAEQHPALDLLEVGDTDSGRPLHLALLSTRGHDIDQLGADGVAFMLVLNAIHPGEPAGVDASMLWLRELLERQDLEHYLGDLAIAVVPFYNVGGALNRNSTTRVNQQGPEQYGFRGNARHLDLNRDFIKADSRNARSFHRLFTRLDPLVFVDTHTTNGADYQYRMSIIKTQPDKLGGKLGEHLREAMWPALQESMAEADEPVVAFVNVYGRAPETGWEAFLDLPRYSTGYAALFHSLGFMSEAHMLKPFEQRVTATRRFLQAVLDYSLEQRTTLVDLRQEDRRQQLASDHAAINWQVDRQRYLSIEFAGYEHDTVTGSVTGLPRLVYDHERPKTYQVPWYRYYQTSEAVSVPVAWVIPAAWQEVIERLRDNGVSMFSLASDTTIEAKVSRINAVQSLEQPWEGHFFHRHVEITQARESVDLLRGDWIVPSDQRARRYLVHALSPTAADSLFRWNGFDSILQRKEHFSPDLFEPLARDILDADPELAETFEARRKSDTEFAANRRAMLDWIYQRSDHLEPAWKRYPVYAIDSPTLNRLRADNDPSD